MWVESIPVAQLSVALAGVGVAAAAAITIRKENIQNK